MNANVDIDIESGVIQIRTTRSQHEPHPHCIASGRLCARTDPHALDEALHLESPKAAAVSTRQVVSCVGQGLDVEHETQVELDLHQHALGQHGRQANDNQCMRAQFQVIRMSIVHT